MKITNIKTTCYQVPIKDPLLMSFKESKEHLGLLVQVETDEGITGVCTQPMLFPRTETIIHTEIKPLVLGQDPFNVEKMVGYFLRGHPALWALEGSVFPMGAVEIACWDIIGQFLNVPLYKLFGGKYRDRVPITAFMGIKEPDQVAQDAVRAVEQGFTTIKLKVGRDLQEDVEIVKAVREAVGDRIELRVDPNQAWSLSVAERQIRKIAEYDPQYIEQPLPRWDFEGLAHLRKLAIAPIAICEGLVTIYRAAELLKRDAVDYISSDPLRMGGLSQAKKLCGLAEGFGVPIVFHVANGSIEASAWAHLAVSSPIIRYANDIIIEGGVGLAFTDDIVKEPIVGERGYMKPLEKPGLGVEIDEDKLAKYAERFQQRAVLRWKEEAGLFPPMPLF
jgi:L-alanine-DL-glutamate epimerase-like enolase superfamily enzyme